MRGWRLPEALWMRPLWVIGWGCAWALIATERLLELYESPQRSALILFGFLLIVGSGGWAARRLGRTRLRYLPLLVLAVIVTREGFHHLLRRRYAAAQPVRSVEPSQSVWHPVTTTDLALRYYALSSRQLTAASLRVVLLTDLHLTRALSPAYYDHVFDVVSAQDADLILLAGDYVSKPKNIELLVQLFARHWPARFGAYAVLGNHDFYTDAKRVRETLSARGISFVDNRCQHLPRSIGRVAICGTEAPWGAELSSDLDRAELNLVLSHTPDNVYRLAERGASLIFSGHTHGGQIRVPGLGSIVVPSRFGRLFDEGHFRVDGADLFVSAGIGADNPALRLYCPPEILVIDISRE
jgi:predicted MPP superfamily phosphohydrolase